MAGVVRSFPSPPRSWKGFLLLSLPKLWEQSKKEGADFWKHLLQATHCYWHSRRSWEEKGEEKGNRKARAYFSLWLLTSVSFFPVFLSIWFLFKGCFKLSPTTSSLSLCSSAYWAQAIHFQMLHLPGSLALSMPISAARLPFIVYLILNNSKPF